MMVQLPSTIPASESSSRSKGRHTIVSPTTGVPQQARAHLVIVLATEVLKFPNRQAAVAGFSTMHVGGTQPLDARCDHHLEECVRLQAALGLESGLEIQK